MRNIKANHLLQPSDERRLLPFCGWLTTISLGHAKGGETPFPMCIARLCLKDLQYNSVLRRYCLVIRGQAYYSVILELVLGPLLTSAERKALIEGIHMGALRKQKVLV